MSVVFLQQKTPRLVIMTSLIHSQNEIGFTINTSVEYNIQGFILKLKVGWSKAGGCGGDAAFFPLLFFTF